MTNLDQLALFGDPADTEPLLPGTWRVRHSRRARRLSIHVLPNGAVEIVAPANTGGRVVRRFVEANREWIRRHAPLAFSTSRPENPASISLPALSRALTVTYRPGQRQSVRQKGTGLSVTGPDLSPQACWPLLRNWLKATGRTHIPKIVARHAQNLGLEPSAIQIRLQRTRWGSCSARGTISINAAGLLLDRREFDYLVAHELCHLRQLNHSARFWTLLEAYEPDCRALDKGLNRAWRSLPHWVYP